MPRGNEHHHWLKGHDTGVLEGPRLRYTLPQSEGWRTADAWPPPEASSHSYALLADGVLAEDEGMQGIRTDMNLGGGLNQARASEADPPSFLIWDSAALANDLDTVGAIELQIDVASTAPDTAFIALLQDVDAVCRATHVTAGYLRAGLHEVDDGASKPSAPALACRSFAAATIVVSGCGIAGMVSQGQFSKTIACLEDRYGILRSIVDDGKLVDQPDDPPTATEARRMVLTCCSTSERSSSTACSMRITATFAGVAAQCVMAA